MVKSRAKKIVYLFILIGIVFYLFWEIYWYRIVGLSCIKWHSHIMLFLIPILILIIYNDWFDRKPNRLNSSLLLIFTTLFIWETILTISGKLKSQQEKVLGFNVDQNQGFSNYQNYYHIDLPNRKIEINKEEFVFKRTTNKLGYSDFEIKNRKSKKEIRVLCLGDSFTEGDGADFEESYVYQLRKNYLKSPTYYVFNAGKCGSDPFFNFVNYSDILCKYDFDIILQTLSSSDLADDIKKRGGIERFQNKYTLKYRKPNTFIEHLYIMSYVGRSFLHFFGYNELLITNDVFEEDIEKTTQLVKKFQMTAFKNKARLILILLPNKKEVSEDYPNYFKRTINKIKKNKSIEIIDLRVYYRKAMKKNPTDFIKKNWWNEDWHHKPKGYLMMAHSIFRALVEKKVISKQ